MKQIQRFRLYGGRVEQAVGYSGDALRTADLTGDKALLRDALFESETWFTMYSAWRKRAEEAERGVV